MGPTEINDLPAHVLLVHVVVVMVPLSALALVLSTTWPAARRRLGVVTPLLALVALVSVPVTTHAGEWLRDRLGNSPLIARHAELGDQLLPYVVGLFVVALAHWVWARFVLPRHAAAVTRDEGTDVVGAAGGTATATRARAVATPVTTTGDRVVAVVFAVLAVAAAVLSVWMVYRIGDSGAKAVWQGSF